MNLTTGQRAASPTARLGRAASSLAIAIIIVSVAGGIATPTAAAPTTQVSGLAATLVDVELTSLEPAAPSPGETLTLAGTITNVSDDPVENVQALLRYDSRPIESRADISRVPDDPALHWGVRPGHVYEIVSDVLEPGGQAGFQLDFTVNTSCFGVGPDGPPCVLLPASGIYAIGVDANLTPDGGQRTTGGTARTVMPWLMDSVDPVDLALIWPLTAPPELTGEGRATPSGDDLALAGHGAPVTWAVDPGVWGLDSHGVSGQPSTTDPANGWWEIIGGERSDVLLLPGAVPDIEALADIDPEVAADVAAQSAGTRQEVADTFLDAMPDVTATDTVADLPTFAAWPAAGYLTPYGLELPDVTGAEVVVLPQSAVTSPPSALSAPIVTVGPKGSTTTAVLTDPVLSGAIADAAAGGAGAALHLRQQWLAATALTARDHASDGRLPDGRTSRDDTGPPPAGLVAAAPLGRPVSAETAAALVDVWTSTEWINPIRLSELDHDRAPHVDLAKHHAFALPTRYAAEVVDLHADVRHYQALLADEPSVGEPSMLTVTRAASATWAADPEVATAQIAEVRATIGAWLESVSIVVNPTNTLSSNTGYFPVNVANSLDRAVNVSIDFQPVNEDRMSIEHVSAQRVEPGEQQTIQVRAIAVANGQVPVSVQLSTVDGAPLGPAQRTIVNATKYGTIGWFVVGGSALLFVLGLGWRMARGRRRVADGQGGEDRVAR